jgi:hypothetical protein
MSFLSFNAEQVAPQAPMEPLPAGIYPAAIEDSEVVPTKSGTGQMLKLNWKVLDGEFKGRVVFDRINVQNQNPKAEEIGQRQLSTLCHAVGVLQLKDSAQLHGIPCMIKVSVRRDETGQYADQNEVKDYRAVEGAVAPASHPTASTPATQPTAANKKPAAPWASNRAA